MIGEDQSWQGGIHQGLLYTTRILVSLLGKYSGEMLLHAYLYLCAFQCLLDIIRVRIFDWMDLLPDMILFLNTSKRKKPGEITLF